MRFLATLAILSAALRATAQPAATFEWKGGIQAGQSLEIRNIIGDIKAEAASGADVEVLVRITGTYPDPSTIRIDVVQHDGGVLLCTIYQGLSTPDHCAIDQTPNLVLSNSDIRVNYTVRVPSGAAFLPRTVNGSIVADLPESPVTAATVNGQIVLSTNSPASAATVNGSILAALGNVGWEGSREFRAVNGSVDLQIPAGAAAAVRANTVWGFITNDFGLEVHRTVVAGWMAGDINGGGPRLALTTVNGSIHLRKPAE